MTCLWSAVVPSQSAEPVEQGQIVLSACARFITFESQTLRSRSGSPRALLSTRCARQLVSLIRYSPYSSVHSVLSMKLVELCASPCPSAPPPPDDPCNVHSNLNSKSSSQFKSTLSGAPVPGGPRTAARAEADAGQDRPGAAQAPAHLRRCSGRRGRGGCAIVAPARAVAEAGPRAGGHVALASPFVDELLFPSSVLH